MAYSIESIDTSSEKRILTGMIVSKEFMEEVIPSIDLSYFQNSYAQKVAGWCIDYYDSMNDVPLDNMEQLFELKKGKLKGADQETVEEFLKDLSERYSANPRVNNDYLAKQTFNYFRKRELEITAGNIQILLQEGKLEEAQAEITKFRSHSRIKPTWVNPFDETQVFDSFQKLENLMFRAPKVLGRYLGPMDRGWLMAIIAPFKRGKTWYLLELAVSCVLQGLRVLFISLEMKERYINYRLYRRITGASDSGGSVVIPVFDCMYNQDGSCNKNERASSIHLLNEEGRKPVFTSDNPYIPCTWCRNNSRTEYEIATWYRLSTNRKKFEYPHVQKQLKAFNELYRNSFRLISFPRFSANTSDIQRNMDFLERRENFIPDAVFIDYAGILKPEEGGSSIGVETVDDTWKYLARMGSERECLVWTASQGTRDSLEASKLKGKHLALWVGILGHVDGLYSLNQTEEEKREGVMKVGEMAHRHQEVKENQFCYVLQDHDIGQIHIDSEIGGF